MKGIESTEWVNFLGKIKTAKEDLGKDDDIWYRGVSGKIN